LWRRLGDARGTAETLLMLGIKLENLGAYGEAAPLVEEAETLFASLGFDALATLAHHHRGVLAYGQGDLTGAAALLEDAVARHRALGDAGTTLAWFASALNDLGVVVGERGDLARAGALHAESLDRWRQAGTLEGVADTLANLATLAAASGHRDRAARLFGAAARLAEALGYAFELPERASHERAADGLRAAMGDAGFAAAWAAGRALSLDDAVAEGIRLPPAPDNAAVRRPAPASGETRGGLSPRELDVLGRLVGGASNREIADALFISPRTVQGHLASIFGKLGVGTRAAAVARAYERKLV
jgi:non-specific serine/threonine protein kinase